MCEKREGRRIRIIKGDNYHILVKVDRCLARLIKTLNDYGIDTISCCCGHGNTKTSSIRIDARNIELIPMGDILTVHLKFPYPGRKK